MELKHKIKGQKNLLSAFCQTTHRTILFSEQYSISKIQNARNICFFSSTDERGGIDKKLNQITFNKKPTFRRVLLACSFPKEYKEKIIYWNSLSLINLKKESQKYSANREFERINLLTEKQFTLLTSSLVTIII